MAAKTPTPEIRHHRPPLLVLPVVATGLVALLSIFLAVASYRLWVGGETSSVDGADVPHLTPKKVEYITTIFSNDDDDLTEAASDVRAQNPGESTDTRSDRNADGKKSIEGRIVDSMFARARKAFPKGRGFEFDVYVTIADGIAELRGTVSSDAVRHEFVEAARECAAAIEGVREVRDALVTRQEHAGEKTRQ